MRKRHQDVRAHLALLLTRAPDVLWIVALDNASAQTMPTRDALFTQPQDRVGLVCQPTDSPQRHLLERLWRVRRGQMPRKQVV